MITFKLGERVRLKKDILGLDRYKGDLFYICKSIYSSLEFTLSPTKKVEGTSWFVDQLFLNEYFERYKVTSWKEKIYGKV